MNPSLALMSFVKTLIIAGHEERAVCSLYYPFNIHVLTCTCTSHTLHSFVIYAQQNVLGRGGLRDEMRNG